MIAVLFASVVPATVFVSKNDCLEVDADNVCVRRGPDEAVRYAVVPADASPAGSRLQISGVEQFDDSNHILFVTVREPELPLFEYWLARTTPARASSRARRTASARSAPRRTSRSR